MDKITLETKITPDIWKDPVKVLKIWTDEIETGLGIAVQDVRGAVIENTPSNTGTLRRSILGIVHKRGGGVEYLGLISTPLEYGKPVETGAKPHWMPIEPLKLWVQRKIPIETRGSRPGMAISERKFRTRKMTEKKDEVSSIAYAIQRSIAKKGTSTSALKVTSSMGFWMFKRGFGIKRDNVLDIFHEVVKRLTKQLGG